MFKKKKEIKEDTDLESIEDMKPDIEQWDDSELIDIQKERTDVYQTIKDLQNDDYIEKKTVIPKGVFNEHVQLDNIGWYTNNALVNKIITKGNRYFISRDGQGRQDIVDMITKSSIIKTFEDINAKKKKGLRR